MKPGQTAIDCVVVSPVPIGDCPDAHIVRLVIGRQRFAVGEYHETRADAELYAETLRGALRRLVQQPGQGEPHDNKPDVIGALAQENERLRGLLRDVRSGITDAHRLAKQIDAALAREEPPFPFTDCTFSGPPPTGHASWSQWAASRPMRGARISALEREERTP